MFLYVHLIIHKTLKVYAERSAQGNACKKHSRLGHLKNKLDKALTRSYAVKFYAGISQILNKPDFHRPRSEFSVDYYMTTFMVTA